MRSLKLRYNWADNLAYAYQVFEPQHHALTAPSDLTSFIDEDSIAIYLFIVEDILVPKGHNMLS